MGLLDSIFGSSNKTPDHAAQEVIAAHLQSATPWERQFCARTMLGAVSACQQLIRKPSPPLPQALYAEQLAKSDYLRIYKIIFAYFWMMLFIHDRRAKTDMRRLLTRITDQNQEDTDNLCDDLETSHPSESTDDPRFSLGKMAWQQIQRSVPSNYKANSMVALSMPIFFDNYRDTVRDLFS